MVLPLIRARVRHATRRRRQQGRLAGVVAARRRPADGADNIPKLQASGRIIGDAAGQTVRQTKARALTAQSAALIATPGPLCSRLLEHPLRCGAGSRVRENAQLVIRLHLKQQHFSQIWDGQWMKKCTDTKQREISYHGVSECAADGDRINPNLPSRTLSAG